MCGLNCQLISIYCALTLSILTITQTLHGVVSRKCRVCVGSGRARDEGCGERRACILVVLICLKTE